MTLAKQNADQLRFFVDELVNKGIVRVSHHQKESRMLYCALLFYLLAIVALVFGFGALVPGSMVLVAKVFSFVFLALFVCCLIRGLRGG